MPTQLRAGWRVARRDNLPAAVQGATLAECAIVAPLLLVLGMTTVQAGLVYHGKSTLNYATFEAARTGATRNAGLDAMRAELGLRLAPLQGGDGSRESALAALGGSALAVLDKTNTRIRILNPTTAAFDDWGIDGREVDGRVMPNSHLRHREDTIGPLSGLSLRDANLLKIEVTYGMELKVPFVNTLISKAMMLVDPDHVHWYARNRFPLKSVATVRMQSEAWEEQVVLANLSPSTDDDTGNSTPANPIASEQTPGYPQEMPLPQVPACDESGLENNAVMLTTNEYLLADSECQGTTTAYSSPSGMLPASCE